MLWKPGDSLPCSFNLATGPYPERHESSTLSVTSILILSCHLYLGLLSDIFFFWPSQPRSYKHSYSPHAYCMLFPPHLGLDHSIYIWRIVQVSKFPYMSFSPACYYSFPSCPDILFSTLFSNKLILDVFFH